MHTRGELEAVEHCPQSGRCGWPVHFIRKKGVSNRLGGADSPDNAALWAAAATSYDRHCGPNAVEAAESDLLGRALEACKSFVEAYEKCLQLEKTDTAVRLARAVLARAGQQTRE